MLDTSMANAIKLSIKCLQLDFFGTSSLELKKLDANNQILEFIFNESNLSPTIELAILDQLEKEENNNFYDFN